MKKLYFDYNATAPLVPLMKEKMMEWMEVDYKNPSSVHKEGQLCTAAIESARKSILKGVDAEGQRLIFTSGGTESNNTLLESCFRQRGSKSKLMITRVEHSCIYNYASELYNRGIEIVWIEMDSNGNIDLEDYKAKLSDDVFLVSVMYANNETGYIFPIKEMTAMAHEHGVPFHTDAVCAMGKFPLSFKDLDVDYLTFSSHKFGGIKGCGGLIYKKDMNLIPYIYGGPQQLAKRAGTENVYGILSSAFAFEVCLKDLDSHVADYKKYREILKEGIKKRYPEVVFNENKENLPQTLNTSFSGLDGNLLLTNLDLEGVEASYGSACASGSLELSRVLKNLKLPLEVSSSSIRFSFGWYTTEDDIYDLLGRLETVLARMTKG